MQSGFICGDFAHQPLYHGGAGGLCGGATNGHAHDFTVQEQILRQPTAYVGVIGSRDQDGLGKLGRLRAAGVSQEAISLHPRPRGCGYHTP